ncbi:Multiple C2 and transmembrane domain-containing protein [Nymphon striatum]|nr:Multiple C2 and transmembrane domain-containing protein [Nymphon striatum]
MRKEDGLQRLLLEAAAVQDENDYEKKPLNGQKNKKQNNHNSLMKRFSKSSSDLSKESNTPTPPGSPALGTDGKLAPEASGEADSEIGEPKIKKKSNLWPIDLDKICYLLFTADIPFAEKCREVMQSEGWHLRRSRDKKDLGESLSNSQPASPSSSPKTTAKRAILDGRPNAHSSSVEKSTEDELRDSGIAIDSDRSILKGGTSSLRQHPFFQLDVHLRNGKGMIAMDTSGTSDPYVKIKCGNRLLHKSKTISKTLDPWWDEIFTLPVEDVFEPLEFKVYDYDFGRKDDFMGGVKVALKDLELNKTTDLNLALTDMGKKSHGSGSLGMINVTFTLIPKTREDKEEYFNKTGKLDTRKMKNANWNSIITIVLVEGQNLLPMDENGLSDPYVKFRLGNEKHKSKNASKTLNPKWCEQFELHVFTDQPRMLEVTVWDRDIHTKDDIMGRCVIDLNKLQQEVTHCLWQDLEDGAGKLHLLITVTATKDEESVSNLDNFNIDDVKKNEIAKSYVIHKAEALASADLGGKSDPFCTLELVNSRVQTQTEYKTLAPNWNKFYTFEVKDVHSMLEVTVYDEDRDRRVEFLGKLGIPLLKIRNKEKRWFALKDKKLKNRAKGQICLEMELIYNPIRASIRTFNPKEPKYIKEPTKFKRALFMRNVNRIKLMALDFVEGAKFLNSCFQWESAPRSIMAFLVFLIVVYFFELYMVPLVLLIVFLKNYIVLTIVGWSVYMRDEEEEYDDEDDDEDDDKEKGLLAVFSYVHELISDGNVKSLLSAIEIICLKPHTANEEKKSLKDKLMAVQEVTAMVQNILGEIASMGESVKNTFNFTVPFLSWLLIVVLTIGTVVLYYVPIRYLIMAWGINKFTKKLRAPHAIPNNEVLDYLSRVPDDEMKIMCRDLRPQIVPGTDGGKIRLRKKTN